MYMCIKCKKKKKHRNFWRNFIWVLLKSITITATITKNSLQTKCRFKLSWSSCNKFPLYFWYNELIVWECFNHSIFIFSDFWKFYSCIQWNIIISRPISTSEPFLYLPSMPATNFISFIFDNPKSLVSVINTCIGLEPSTRAWETTTYLK